MNIQINLAPPKWVYLVIGLILILVVVYAIIDNRRVTFGPLAIEPKIDANIKSVHHNITSHKPNADSTNTKGDIISATNHGVATKISGNDNIVNISPQK